MIALSKLRRPTYNLKAASSLVMMMHITVFSEYDKYSTVAHAWAKQWASLVCKSLFINNLFSKNLTL